MNFWDSFFLFLCEHINFYKWCRVYNIYCSSNGITRWNNFLFAKESEFVVAETRVRKKEWHRERHESTNAKRTTSVWDQETVCTKVRRVVVGQYGPVHCPSFRPSSRSFTIIFAGSRAQWAISSQSHCSLS